MKCLNISLEESQTPYVLHVFKIIQAVPVLGSQEYYGFCESDLAHSSLEIKEKELLTKKELIKFIALDLYLRIEILTTLLVFNIWNQTEKSETIFGSKRDIF